MSIEWRLTYILFSIHLLMKLFICFIFAYFVIFKHYHYYHILAIDTNNISFMNTSTKITSNRIPHINLFIILSFSVFSSIILCLYAIFHNRKSISMIKQKINTESLHFDMENDLLTISDSNTSDSNVLIQQTSSVLSKTNRSF